MNAARETLAPAEQSFARNRLNPHGRIRYTARHSCCSFRPKDSASFDAACWPRPFLPPAAPPAPLAPRTKMRNTRARNQRQSRHRSLPRKAIVRTGDLVPGNNPRHCCTLHHLLLSGVACAALYTGTASAQEFALFSGVLRGNGDHTYAWAMDYQEGLGRYAALGFTWYNEGHIPDHHRDGQAVQLWGRLPLAERRFVISAGAGPYRYFDTTAAGNGRGYADSHGWGVLMSVRAAYYTSHRWVAQVQLNRAQIFGGPSTTSVMFGVGYQLVAPTAPGARDVAPRRDGPVTHNEISAMLGETILNSSRSPSALGGSVEYRRGVLNYVDWTATYLYEGSKKSIRRNGVATQLWLTRAFFDERLTLGIGAGAYVAIDERSVPGKESPTDGRLAGLISISASYRLSQHWSTRITWNRVMTHYNRDTDVIQAGVGYRF
jgi:hypothetical protein